MDEIRNKNISRPDEIKKKPLPKRPSVGALASSVEKPQVEPVQTAPLNEQQRNEKVLKGEQKKEQTLLDKKQKEEQKKQKQQALEQQKQKEDEQKRLQKQRQKQQQLALEEQKKQKKLLLKQKKEEKKKNKKPVNKKLLAGIIGLCFVLVGVGVFAVYFLIEQDRINNQKLKAPTLEVVQLSNRTIAEATKTENSTKYEFIIKNDEKEISLLSSANYIELNSYLSQAGQYSVKVRVYGKGPGATSDFSNECALENYVKLKSPNVYIKNVDKITEGGQIVGYSTYSTSKEDDEISWQAVDNAVKYHINYRADIESDQVSYVEVNAKEGLNTFKLSAIYENGAGLYQLSVIAIPQVGSYYLKSDYKEEDVISLSYYTKESTPQDVEYNRNTKKLTFKIQAPENFVCNFELNIYYAGNSGSTQSTLNAEDMSSTYDNGYLCFVADLNQIISADVMNMWIKTLKTNMYSSDSVSVQASIN